MACQLRGDTLGNGSRRVRNSFGRPDELLMSLDQLRQFQKAFSTSNIKTCLNFLDVLCKIKLIDSKTRNDVDFPREWYFDGKGI